VSLTLNATPWQLQFGVARGVPGGFIQVRENNVPGTSLPLEPILGIDYVQRHRQVRKTRSARSALIFNLNFASIYGESVRPIPIYYNGVQLAANYPLTSCASWLNNWQMRAEKVYVPQTNQKAQAGPDYHWEKVLQIVFGWYDRYFMQNEQSTEDGNYILLTEHCYYLNLCYRF